MNETDSKNLDLNPMGLLSLLLSFVSLCVVTTILLLPKDAPLYTLLLGIDTLICLIFLLQIATHFLKSDNKITYLRRCWIDILASIPVIEALRFARIFQIFRVIRLIQQSHSLLSLVNENRNETTMATILLLLMVIVSTGSAAIFVLESPADNANITSLMDAMWWVFVTISTVGYGDHYPVTSAGRAVAVVMIMCGVGIFGAITGLVTSYITKPHKKEQEKDARSQAVLEQLLLQQNDIMVRLAAIEEKLAQSPAKEDAQTKK